MDIILAFIILLICSSACLSAVISTSSDGSFQAIAQSSDTISLYWKTGEDAPVILQDGCAYSDLRYSTDPLSGFSTALIGSLTANTLYTFSLGPNGPVIAEKTWCALPQESSFDVLVVGATASGVAAALTVARLGMTVALVEETNRIGGMASNGLGSTDIRSLTRSNGIFEDFRRRVAEFYGEGNGLRYEPRLANALFKSMLYEQKGISVFLKTRVVKPTKEGARITGALFCDISSGRTGNISACVTIDASDTGDFAAACSAKYVVGREARSEAEPHAGAIYFDDATQQILPGSTGEADCKQQSYAYLMIWKDFGDELAPEIEKPANYNPEVYRHSPLWEQTWNNTSGRLPNAKFEINQHPFGIDWPGINHDYPTATPERRREIESLYRDRALGYLYFIQNEQGLKNLGLADDEFLDNGNFPMSLYVREARRVVGSCFFTERDVTKAQESARLDSIAIGDYPMDSHAVEELKDPARLDKGEGEMWLAQFTPWYQVPYRVMVPIEIDGLIVSTAVSATHVGYGTLRMEPVRMSLGQAAGAAAYWCTVYGKEPREINSAWIQDKILSQYAYVGWNSDVDRATRHFKAINFLTARGFFPGITFRPEDSITDCEALDALNLMLHLEGCACRIAPDPRLHSSGAITRGIFAMWLVESKQMTSQWWRLLNPQTPSYADVPPGSVYYSAIETLHAHRIDSALFADYEQGLFKPNEPMSRADAAEAIFLSHRVYAMTCATDGR